MASTRADVVRELAGLIARTVPGRALVGVDGVDGAGKTCVVAELAGVDTGRPVVVASIDGFHRPKAERRAAGDGPEGFYRGSYRYDAFREAVVGPLRAGREIVPAVWDVERDAPVPPRPTVVPEDGIVLVDGIFLQRPELAGVWDATVFVDVPFAVSVPRGNARWPGDHDPDPEAAIHHRYVGGQRLYLAEADPLARATWVLDNTDLDHPRLLTDEERRAAVRHERGVFQVTPGG